MRRAHVLRANDSVESPHNIIWFDTESKMHLIRNAQPKEWLWFHSVTEVKKREKLGDTVYHQLKFGWACYKYRIKEDIWSEDEWFRFTDAITFWRWVDSKTREKSRLYLFCHNTSFDLPCLDVFKILPAMGYKLRGAIVDAPPTILRFRRGQRTIILLDSLNIWRMPLAQLGKEIGNVKYEMPDDNDLGIDWDTYGRHDVEIIRDSCISWIRFIRANDYGSFAPTLASQAMRVYRHRYMRHRIYIDNNPKALDLTREGYYGGRNECFRIGRFKGEFSLLDVNSMYPFVMSCNPYPYKLMGFTTRASVSDLSSWLAKSSVTARVVLRTSKPFVPYRSDGKLIFPIGEFECILSTPELKYALQYAEILQVKEAAVYEHDFLFAEMMNDLYNRRVMAKQSGHPVEAFMFRKIMNSFYGKWGQTGAIWENRINIEDTSSGTWIDYDYEAKTCTYYRKLGGLVQSRAKEVESKDSFPAIAGHVTAYARMALWNIISGADSSHVFYADTDSVLVDSVGRRNLHNMVHGDTLGGLSVKGEYDDIEIWACKDYRFGPKSKTKGVRKDAMWVDDHNVHQTKWSGLRGLIASGIVDKPITKRIRKHLNRLYDKGEILSDGTCQPRLILPG